MFPGRGRLGPSWDATTTYGRFSWGPFGTWSQIKSIREAEHDLRRQIDEFLAQGIAPRLPGFVPTVVGWSIVGLAGVAIGGSGAVLGFSGLTGFGLLIACIGFAFAGAAVLRRTLNHQRSER